MAVKRIKLEAGKQRELIERAKAKNGLSWRVFANVLGVNCDYLRTELRHETRTLRAGLFEKLCKMAGKKYGPFIRVVLDCNWGQRKGGANSNAGGKRGNKIKPPELNEKFAELIGAYLGDGTLTKYFMRITADKRYCLPYLEYLSRAAEDVLGIKPTIRIPSKRNIAYLEIRSKEFCSYLNGTLGLPFGDKIKNESKIPNAILADKKLATACLRGLMDTDGSFSKRGSYMCLEFTSYNPHILKGTWQIGERLGIFTHKNKVQAGTNSWQKIIKHFNIVGSSNRIHIIRFYERFYNGKLLYKTDLFRYFKKYDAIPLPFTGPWSSG